MNVKAPQAGGPYRRSWADALIGFVEGLPGPNWLFYALVSVAFVVVGTGFRWLSGTLEVGTVSAVRVAIDLLVVYGLAAMHFLKKRASVALDVFRPALGELEGEFDRLGFELTTLSRRAGVVGLAIGIAFATLSLLGGPAAWDVTTSAGVAANSFFISVAYIESIFLVLLIAIAFRQLRVVIRIHRDATNVHLLETRARNGFSPLTLASSISVALPVYVSALSFFLDGSAGGGVSPADVTAIGVIVMSSALLFLVPLYGLHRRLLRARAAALATTGQSFAFTTEQLHERIRLGSFDQLDGLNSALASLAIERDVLRKASTWPWEAETFRGFVSSIALPILIWLITTYLGRLLGA